MVPSAGWCSTPRRRSAFALIALALAVLAATAFRPPPTIGPFARDFEAYYAAGATWNAGGDPWSRDIWQTERTIPGVDATRDELLPFAGPAASLPLWSVLARLPFDAARVVWLILLAPAFAILAVAAAALAHVRLTAARAAIACGMPLPCEPGKNLCARNAEAAKALGVIKSARYGEKDMVFWKAA